MEIPASVIDCNLFATKNRPDSRDDAFIAPG